MKEKKKNLEMISLSSMYRNKSHEKDLQNPNYQTNVPIVLSADILSASKLKLLSDMTPDQSLDANVSIGLRDFSGEQYKSSLKRLNKAILQHPWSITPRFVRGLCFEKLCQYDSSLKDFEICCKLGLKQSSQYESALAYFNRGVISTCLKNFDDAMKFFNAAINLHDLDPDFYGSRALLFRRKGDFQNAQNDYQYVRRLSLNHGHEVSPFRRKKVSHASPTLRRRLAKTYCKEDNSDVKSTFYGQLFAALTCIPNDRTPHQLDILVKETKMMTAFIHLDIDQLRTVWKYLEYKKYATNTRIFEQGDPADDYFVIWTGCVSARLRKETATIRHANVARAFALETEFVVNKMKAGETLGEAALKGETRKAACVTEEPTELLILRKIHFESTFCLFLERLNVEKVEFLSKLQCFKNFEISKLKQMADFISEHKFEAGHEVIRQNDSADSLYFIKSGLIAILRTPENNVKEKIDNICLTKVSSGDIFGEAAALQSESIGGSHPSTALCETKSVCYRLNKNQICRCGWDNGTRRVLAFMAVKYPPDIILVQAFKSRIVHEKVRKKLQKELRKYIKHN